MSDEREAEIKRLRSIEHNIAVFRVLAGILPIWMAGEILIRSSRENMWGYGLTVLGLTAALLVLGITRQVMITCFVGPDHRFFNDARRVAAFIDRTKARGYIPVYGPGELLKLKALNIVFRPLGWGLLFALMLGGYIFILDTFSNGQPWPNYAGLYFKWGMPTMFLLCSGFAISDVVRTINSKDAADFPLTKAIFSRKSSAM